MTEGPIHVYTDLNPSDLTEVAVETYRLWLRFALGQKAIGGKTLQHPSGRYAASISWKRIGRGAIAIIADPKVSPEADTIEYGRKATDLRASMLQGGKVAKDGHRYRVIPMKSGTGYDGQASPLNVNVNAITQTTESGGGATSAFAGMWGEKRGGVEHDRFVTMTDKPDASKWIVPAFQPYTPAKILADMIERDAARGR